MVVILAFDFIAIDDRSKRVEKTQSGQNLVRALAIIEFTSCSASILDNLLVHAAALYTTRSPKVCPGPTWISQ